MREPDQRRRSLHRRALAAFVLLAWAPACGPDRPERAGDPALDADVRVSPTPAVLRGSRVTIAALDDGMPLIDADIRVRVEADRAITAPPESTWRSAPPSATSVGVYGPVEFDFSAPGAWWVIVELRASDGRLATLRHPLSVVGPAPSEVGR